MEAHLHEIKRLRVVLFSVLVISICSISYELLIGSLSSYLLGNSIAQFSITIGVFLFAMGLGSFFSRFIKENLVKAFVNIELSLGIIGGFSISFLFLTYSYTRLFYLFNMLTIVAIGFLVGLEIPIITRIIKGFAQLKRILADVFSIDYIGGLIGSIIYPFILLPYFGLVQTSYLIGIFNILSALLILFAFKDKFAKIYKHLTAAVITIAIFVFLFLNSYKITSFLEQLLYEDQIIFEKQTPYQKIVITRWKNDLRMYIDGNLQFSTRDEYRYHEAIVHPAMSLAANINNILIMGGGDGFAAREVLKYREVSNIVLVDIDKEITKLCSTLSIITQANNGSLLNPKVHIINEDAFKFLEENTTFFDVIIADFPDPHGPALSKLYSKEFYELVKKALSRGGIFVTQSTSPYFAKKAFWCINNTLKSVFKYVIPYKVYIPSFGLWGFNIASKLNVFNGKINHFINNGSSFRFYSYDLLSKWQSFPSDIAYINTKINFLNFPIIYKYYIEGWKQWN